MGHHLDEFMGMDNGTEYRTLSKGANAVKICKGEEVVKRNDRSPPEGTHRIQEDPIFHNRKYITKYHKAFNTLVL